MIDEHVIGRVQTLENRLKAAEQRIKDAEDRAEQLAKRLELAGANLRKGIRQMVRALTQ